MCRNVSEAGSPAEDTVSGIILAAGESRRFGGTPKQLLELDGETLVHRVSRRAAESRLGEIIVVTGYLGDRVSAAVADLPVRLVDNPDYAEGQSSSVRVGLQAASPSSAGALFIPADQPGLSTELIDQLINVHTELRSTGSPAPPIVIPTFAGRRGTPVLFDKALFSRLLEITGDRGGRQLFVEHEDKLIHVPVSDGLLLSDVDTPEDWERWLKST